jgi:hypothetical protein
MPLLLAASPPPMPVPGLGSALLAPPMVLEAGTVETFDPVGRARLIAELIPRTWRGSYRAFDGSAPLPVQLELASATPMGQMVDLRGQMRIGDIVTPVQGNLNAKSDQLDLLLLADRLGNGLEAGGQFQGLQGLSLSGWFDNRLTSLGGRLQLSPGSLSPAEGTGGLIRGLW